ncbi:hypothetical protein [Pseudomonas amygdali]|uniref:hypothetical protein n=1 Tax=Pseudomonas amygdali TaxID=47877 RepID=UPI000E3CCF69|nr:hypothetical protein [Pseudomonas amygdali]
MTIFTLNYRLNDEPKGYQVVLEEKFLSDHEAAIHLIELHYGDSESWIVMPDASPEDILVQAELLGLWEINITLEA